MLASPRMEIVLIHLGWPVPDHLAACAGQIRAVSGREPLIVDPRRGASYRSPDLRRFRRVEYLSHLGLGGFWRYSCERFFVLEALMRERGIEACLHIESDNLIYVPPTEYEPWLREAYGPSVAVCPLTDTEDTAAVMYVGSVAALSEFNRALVGLVGLGSERLLAQYGGELANEMRMLNIIRTSMGLCSALPTTPAEALTVGARWLFDPASYGQFLDGVPGEPGRSWVGDHHVVGREILRGRCEVSWDPLERAPAVRAQNAAGRGMPLANLHIHSKRLQRWMATGAFPEPVEVRRPRRRDGAVAARLTRVRGRILP
jgi:hypothetical protein